VLGSFGSATACTLLHAYRDGQPLSADKLITAWGHALSQTSGTMQFSVDASGGAVKRVHAGYAARNGVISAELADTSIATPRRSLDGRYGAAHMFGGNLHTEGVLRQPGEVLQIHKISVKPYSCCRIFHSTIDALGEVTDGYKTAPERIRSIVVYGPQLIEDQHMMRRPRSVMAAQYSCPYLIGASLIYGPSRYDAYSEAFHDDARILQVADLVSFAYDAELEAMYPRQFPTAVELTLNDGTVRKSLVTDSFGTPARPLSVEQIATKGKSLLREIDSTADLERCQASLWDDAVGGAELARIFANH